MEKMWILVAVKTYPVLSKKYRELVCTAGFREDGSWIRLYPLPFRLLKEDERFEKYRWIKLAIEKNRKDPRPETYRPRDIDDITLGKKIGTKKGWQHRRDFILSNNKIHTNLQTIIDGACKNDYSLVIFKPTQIKKVVHEEEKDPLANKEAYIKDMLTQGSLFSKSEIDDGFNLIRQLPYQFSYCFTDDEGRKSTLRIIDWETNQLYWNCFEKSKCEKVAIDKVKEKYFNDLALTKDIYLFLGTTLKGHNSLVAGAKQQHNEKHPTFPGLPLPAARAKRLNNPYIITGIFYPPPIVQPPIMQKGLFDS